jgi:hypothetical protein
LREEAKGHVGFLTSPKFAIEKEFRLMLTVPDGTEIEPRKVSSATLRKFVERVA